MALRAYNSPGVSVRETNNPALAPLLANPSVVAVVGSARGEQVASERLTLTGTDAETLRYTGVDEATVLVKLAATGETLNAGTYVVTQGTDPDATVTGDEPTTIARFAHPTTAPTVSATGTGALTGTYRYAVTFVNANGETGIGPESPDAVITAAGFNLSAIPLGPTGTTARNIYRKKVSSGGDNKFHLVATIGDNTGTTVTNEATTDATAQGDGVSTFGTAQPPTGIATGDTVVVTYDYTDNFYYEPTLFDDLNALYDKYGDPYDADGNVDSELSFAARLAFVNGASEVVAVAATADSDSAIESALTQLEDVDQVRLVVAARGTAAVSTAVAAHVTKMNNQGLYRMGIVGRDGSAAAITAETLRAAAKGLVNEAIVHVSPASFTIENPVTGRPMNIGGQYAAAAIAGMFSARDVQVPLTKKAVAGFSGYSDKRTASELALDSSAGLMVIENRGGVLQIRHGVTTAVGDSKTQEASVVRAKYDMAHRVRTSLESSLIGTVASPTAAPLLVRGTVAGVLDQLIVEGVISGFTGVSARMLDSEPTTVEVRFSYTPAWPINNIDIIFNINTTTGEFGLAA